jgi:hypothetical protein
VFTARYALSRYIKQICFVFKGLTSTPDAICSYDFFVWGSVCSLLFSYVFCCICNWSYGCSASTIIINNLLLLLLLLFNWQASTLWSLHRLSWYNSTTVKMETIYPSETSTSIPQDCICHYATVSLSAYWRFYRTGSGNRRRMRRQQVWTELTLKLQVPPRIKSLHRKMLPHVRLLLPLLLVRNMFRSNLFLSP